MLYVNAGSHQLFLVRLQDRVVVMVIVAGAGAGATGAVEVEVEAEAASTRHRASCAWIHSATSFKMHGVYRVS